MVQDANASPPHEPQLVAHGVRLGEQVVPLLVGSCHYFHLDVAHWAPALRELRRLGVHFVDTYVPWSVHELGEGSFDFGTKNPRHNVAEFLRLAREAGLYAIVRPGPHVNAELTRFGIPERVIWDEDCMAVGTGGTRVVLPAPPLAFPLPSYASRKFHGEVARWFQAVGTELGGMSYPAGPIVMVQVDNEAALGFRDGIFDQDHHPDALAHYRNFLRQKYRSIDILRKRYNNPAASFARLCPPEAKLPRYLGGLPPLLDWAEAQESMIAGALGEMAARLRQYFSGVLLSHNLPPGWESSVLDPARLEQSVDLVGLDYYHQANSRQRHAIFARTSELRTRSEQRASPCYAAELGVGFPPYFSPHSEADSRFTALTALAYGVQGFNLYMAVERSRWIGAPIGVDGTPYEEAEFYRALLQAVERTQLHRLVRPTEVTIVVPHELRRLSRTMHVLGPLSATLLSAMSGDPLLGPSEQDLGLPSSLVIDSFQFLALVEQALERRHVPYRIASGDQLANVLEAGGWTVVICCSAMRTDDLASIRDALARGKAVTLGPHFPERDQNFEARRSRTSFGPPRPIPELLGLNEAAIDETVETVVANLGLTRLSIDHEQVYGTLFRKPLEFQSEASEEVGFLINPTLRSLTVTWSFETARRARDAISLAVVASGEHDVQVTLPPQSTRMLELAHDS